MITDRYHSSADQDSLALLVGTPKEGGRLRIKSKRVPCFSPYPVVSYYRLGWLLKSSLGAAPRLTQKVTPPKYGLVVSPVKSQETSKSQNTTQPHQWGKGSVLEGKS